jgi:hypothetical protein
MGVAQSAGTLARVFGPAFATALYGVQTHLSFYLTAAIAAVAGAAAWHLLVSQRQATVSGS